MRAAEFGAAVGYGEDLVYKIEGGKRIPRQEYLAAADRVLGAGGLIAATWEDAVGPAHRGTVPELQHLDPPVQTGVGLTARRHHLEPDVAQPAHLQQALKLLPPDHCAPDRAPQRGLLLDETERRGRRPLEHRPASHARGHQLFHFVR